MADTVAAERIEDLLDGLNAPQREAVTHGEGPLLILAGAGSGKTRVLTHRIAYLVYTGQAGSGEILAITFTNKAAQEMRERVELLLGRRTAGMWVLTFHAACARMLRAEAQRLGYTRQFTIYDQADSRRLVKRCSDELGIDPKRFSPAALQHQISDAKNKLRDADAYRQLVGSFFEQTVADVYELYEREMHRSNAMDFDDLLVRAVNVLELFPEVRERYASAFRHVLVDEYQDTNHAQYRWLQLLAGGTQHSEHEGGPVGHRNLAVVGDDDQCLVAGTQVQMADGSTRPIEEIRAGDLVRSCYGSGDFRPANVTAVHRSEATKLVRITTWSGKQLVSTPEHVHFAGYLVGRTPQLHMTYLMWKRGVGFRVGTSRTYAAGQAKPMVGVKMRISQEGADAGWVISVHATEAHARFYEAQLSLSYGLPTVPFKARRNGSLNGLVGDQNLLDQLFAQLDTETAGRRLLADGGLSLSHPHFSSQTFTGRISGDQVRRRRLVLTLCGDHRARTPRHRIAMFGYDDPGRLALQKLGLSVRPARRGSHGWRFETVAADFATLQAIVDRISGVLDVTLQCNARLAKNTPGDVVGNSLPFLPAASVRPGMSMIGSEGEFEVVMGVDVLCEKTDVHDLDVEGTHNFVAEGLVTHNSIYGFRGADIRNILDFEDDFPDAHVVKLEQNYRSTQTILSAANAVVAHNRGRKSKALWTEVGEGDPIKLRELDDEHAEARFVVGEIERLVDEGVGRSEIAVFYRTNAQSRVLEDTLVRREIAYQVIGGTKFYERAEIKDAIAYLTLLGNHQDVISFTRVANSPRRGIGQTSLSRVIAHASTVGIDVWDAAAEPAAVPGLGTAAVRAISRFMDTMASLAQRAAQGIPVGDLLQAVLHESGYLDALEAERTIEAQGRVENLQELVEVAREFDATAEPEQDTLDVFLQQIALVSDADTREDDEGLVTLMTLHNAKGLEYPIVFIIGCEDGVFPHSRALDEGGLEEERRLCYVGITRAMRDLYLVYARRRAIFGAQSFGTRSRFLDEIPDELTDRDEQPLMRRGAGLAARAGSWADAAASGAERAKDAPAAIDFRLGADVVHAAFGDGVVTGVEPGGIVVVRFASDGSERKLMAEFAPISPR